MRKLIALCLVLCTLLGMAACTQPESPKTPNRIDPFGPSEGTTTPPEVEEPSETPDTSEIPQPVSYAEKAEQYLEEKYQKEFSLENDYGQLMEFTTPGEGSNIKVATLGYIRKDNTLDWSLYTTEFVDDGYVIFNQDKLVDYFEQFVDEQYGDTKLAVTYSAIAMPSDVTLDTSIEDIQAMTDRACFTVYGLVQNELEYLETMRQALSDSEHPIRIELTYPYEAWESFDSATVAEIIKYVQDSGIVHKFSANLSSWMCTAQEYLEQKYGMRFYADPDMFDNLLQIAAGYQVFLSPDAEGKFLVATQETLKNLTNANPKWFTEAYADNGYYILHQEEIQQYYEELFGDGLGEHKILLLFSDIFPSHITPDMPFEEAVKALPEAMNHKVMLLAEHMPSKEVLQAIADKLQTEGFMLELQAAEVPALLQAAIDVISAMGLEFDWSQKIN